jgi:hypothetical protein
MLLTAASGCQRQHPASQAMRAARLPHTAPMSEQRRSAVSKFIATEQLARQRNAAPAARSAA